MKSILCIISLIIISSCSIKPLKKDSMAEIYDIPTEETESLPAKDQESEAAVESEDDELAALEDQDDQKQIEMQEEISSEPTQENPPSVEKTEVLNSVNPPQKIAPPLRPKDPAKRQKVGPFFKITPTNNSLIYAAKNGTIETLKRLLHLNLDINYKNKNGNTPLIMAIKYKRYGNVKFLLAKGADKTIVNSAGLTPLELAKRLNAHRIIQLLR